MYPWEIAPYPHEEGWSRLFREGKAVGFRRPVGKVYFYSPDGYAWSGKAIEFDTERQETGLRNRSDLRVFDGDIVLMPHKSGERQLVKMVILHHDEWGALCWMPDKDWIQPVSKLHPNTPRVIVQDIVGTVYEDKDLSQQSSVAKNAYGPDQCASWQDVSWLLAMLLSVGGLFVAAQLTFWSSIGPLATCAGGALGADNQRPYQQRLTASIKASILYR